jgi:hypothetical protein
VKTHVKVVLHDVADGLEAKFDVVLNCDCDLNLFQRPDVFAIVFKALNGGYCCCKFTFLCGSLFKELSLVVCLVFVVANDFAHCLDCRTVLYGSRCVG